MALTRILGGLALAACVMSMTPRDGVAQGAATVDEALLGEYLHVFSAPDAEAFVRPGFCETGAAEILLHQHVPTPSAEWTDFGPLARSVLVATSYWRDDDCATRRTLNVVMRIVFDGVEYARFGATIEGADKVSSPRLDMLADPPAGTEFSGALAGLTFENFRPVLPPEWVPGAPPGISSSQDPRHAHAVYVEGLAAKPDLYAWNDESLAVLDLASAAGHRGASDQLLQAVDFRSVVSRVFYNLSQGNAPIDDEMRGVVASHWPLYERAIDQGLGSYVYLEQALSEYDFSISEGGFALAENAPPNHYDLTGALNRRAGTALNPVSDAYVALAGLPAGSGWECDGTWCVAMGGLANLRFVARAQGIDCALTRPGAARCAFDLVHVLRGHAAFDTTVQGGMFEALMAPARAVPKRAEADLVRRGDGWEITSLISVR